MSQEHRERWGQTIGDAAIRLATEVQGKVIAPARRAFPVTEEDRVWAKVVKPIMEHGGREPYRVADLLETSDDPMVRKRVIQALLVPDFSQLPFSIGKRKPESRNWLSLSDNVHWRKRLREGEAVYAANLVERYIVQSQAGRKDELPIQEDLIHYNNLVRGLLPRLPQGRAERLFRRFEINDIAPFSNIDNSSGYNPLETLLFDRGVPKRWKQEAISRMHRVIREEEAGRAQPRAWYEGASRCYRIILGNLLIERNQGQCPVEDGFLAKEVMFLMSATKTGPVLDPWHTGQAMDLPMDKETQLHPFIRRQVFRTEDTGDRADIYFQVVDSKSHATALKIMRRFPEDTELVSCLKKQTDEWLQRQPRTGGGSTGLDME